MSQNEPVAIITGGASGIGLASVLRLAKAGYRVIAADYNIAAGEKAIGETNGKATLTKVDVRSEEDVAKVVEEAMTKFGRLDVMFNNAGVGGAFGALADLEAEDWDYTFEVLVRGVFFGMKHASKVMKAGGSIINTGSAAAYNGGFGPLAYSAAKAAVVSMSRSAAVELGPRMIRVNTICPGGIRTPLLDNGRGDKLDAILPAGQPMPRWGQPDDIAKLVEFLAGPNSEFISGEQILVDGGLIAAGPGPDFQSKLGTDPRMRGLAGVNRGSTGEKSIVRKRAPRE